MKFLDVWDVFSGRAALEAHLLTEVISADLRKRPRAIRVDRWQRPLFVSYGVVTPGYYVVCLKGLCDMTRKKGMDNASNSGRPNGGFPPTQWVNVGFSPEAERECAIVAANPDGCAVGFVGLASSGDLDISLKRTDKGEFMACLFGSGGAGERLGVSAWGGTPADAIAGLLTKWHVMLDGSFSGLTVPTERSRFR